MVISKAHDIRGNDIGTDGAQLERVHKLVYLGSNINDQWDPSIEIKTRIERARAAFIQMKKSLTSPNLTLKLRTKMVHCYVFPVPLYIRNVCTDDY